MFETKTNVKLHDTDAAGVVFFVNYFRIAHTAYEAFLKSIGCGLDFIIRQSDYLVLIAHAEADYMRALQLGDVVTIGLKAVKVGDTSFELLTQLMDKSGNLAATVRTVHVAVSKKTAEKMEIPEKIRVGLKSIS
jgi:1,4-dihydroxy-2-naphthoyl-CoA hydrolase